MNYSVRGVIYDKLEDYNAAIRDFSTVIRFKPDASEGYLVRGIALAKSGDYNAAIIDFTTTIRLDSNDAKGYKQRGIAKEDIGLHYCGDFKKACKLGDEDSCEWYYEECI